MVPEYGEYVGGAVRNGELLTEDSWEPSVPKETATLWRYMSFAKLLSLLERKEIFFSLVAEMEDQYEGFIYPLAPQGDESAFQHIMREVLHTMARSSLISCWTESDHESSLMWKAYAGSEGVAICTTFERLRKSIHPATELPITFGRVEYVDYGREEIPRFGIAPLFHKRIEYRGEGEVRAVLPGPPAEKWLGKQPPFEVQLDLDVETQRGRYVPIDVEVLVEKIVLPPDAASWFAEVLKSAISSPSVRSRVVQSSI